LKRSKAIVGVALLCFLFGASPVFADSPHNNLSLTLNGAILNSGTESYYHYGGQLVAGSILGYNLDLSKSDLHYWLTASVSGVAVSGHAGFEVDTVGGEGAHYFVTGDAQIGSMVPAEQFPLGCTFGVDCTSAIPGLFLGLATVTITKCDDGQSNGQGNDQSNGQGNSQGDGCRVVYQQDLPMQFESAFLNPFGGPILMASNGGEVFLIANYSAAKVTWSGIQLGGVINGSLSGNPVSGTFGMKVSAVEDLKAGTEVEAGKIAFFGMSPSSLDAAGGFMSRSTIPPGTACPPSLGFPPGTCQITGFNTKGEFSMQTQRGGSIEGSFVTIWTAPAVLFTSSVTATFKSQ
jgi:hypothetical protein